MIRRIAGDTIRPLAAAQVIVDLASATKELVDNAIDAHATQITVTFTNYGLDALEVQDNGRGIPAADMPLVGQRSHTSKLEDESALYTVRTLGFRGEALHSLAALSTNLTITSKCHREESNPLGVRLTIGGHLRPGVTNDGQLLEDVPCNVGTIVKVEGLLSTLPVRREEWQRNARRHFSRALYFVQSYVLAAKGVKLRCLHGRQVLFSSSGSGQMARAYVEAFGGMADLKPSTAIPASISAPSGPGLGSFSLSLTSIDMECTLYYAPARRKTADRQFMFINGRPTELAPLFKRLNEATRTAGWDGYALIIVEAHLGGLLDVNLTPDKRQVMLPYEGELIGALVERFSAELSQAALISQVSTPGSDNPRLLPSQTTFSTNAKEEGKATTANTALSPLQSSETASSTRVEQPTLQKSRTVSPLSATIDALPDTQSMISMPLGCDEGKDIGSHTVLTIEKSDFGRMEIIGQYNCGFILTRLSVPGTSAYHVYIIDQHASDERFRLETLERSLRHTTQSLIQPMSLISLGLDDLMLIDVNRDLLQECGFILTRDSNKVLQITGFPRVMGVQLGFPDFVEALGLVQAEEFRGLHSLARVKTALGYKACRSAIMIGDPLTLAQMTQVVRNLATLRTPWICAHGRPTVRVLFSST